MLMNKKLTSLKDTSNAIEVEVSESKILQDFIIETKGYADVIEMSLPALKEQQGDTETIFRIVRAFHSIKGFAGFVDQELIRKIAHQTEVLLELYRKGNIKMTDQIIGLILISVDYIKNICNNYTINQNEEFITLIDSHLQKLSSFENGSR